MVSITVREGYAGERPKLQQAEDGVWKMESVSRGDTPVLFYDLGNLKVLERSGGGDTYGYDRNGQKVKITFDTTSVFAMKNGHAEFEITGSNLDELRYDAGEKAFIKTDSGIILYHLDENGCRDAKVDPYTGLAYADAPGKKESEQEPAYIYVWPVYE